MPPLLPRKLGGQPSCFYCHSAIQPRPKNTRNFTCAECGCLNKYDEKGVIVGDEPAMRDESLNAGAFGKRASPSKSRLPTNPTGASFCHSCRTNQSLLVNLLSNYLPEPSDPTYQSRLESLPAYERSLQERYPPVCPSCQPMVDEEIRRKDFMAQTLALGVTARQGKKMLTRQRMPSRRKDSDVWIWRIRGALWYGTILAVLAQDISDIWDRHWLESHTPPHFFPAFYFLSLLWIFWDPTWRIAKKEESFGRPVRVMGRSTYLQCQFLAWFIRLCGALTRDDRISYRIQWPEYLPLPSPRVAATLQIAFELTVILISYQVPYVQKPAHLRLISPSTRSTPAPPDFRASSPAAHDALRSAISNGPQSPGSISTSGKLRFGLPSLPNAMAPNVAESNMMDWVPTNSVNQPPEPQKDSYVPVLEREGWMRPATFHAPEQPTGLEELLENTTLELLPSNAILRNSRESNKSVFSTPSSSTKRGRGSWSPRQWVVWSGLGIGSLSVLVGFVLYLRRM